MDRKYLENISQAKQNVQLWLSNIEQKNIGIHMFSNENNLGRAETDFAIWYYGEGQVFSSFLSFRELERHYNEMYDLFVEYENIYKEPVSKGVFSNKSNKKKKDDLAMIIQALRISNKKLIKSIDFFEDKVLNSPLFTSYSKETNKKVTPKNKEILIKPEQNRIKNDKREVSKSTDNPHGIDLDEEIRRILS